MPTATNNIKTEEITYEADGIKMKGFLAYDANKTGPRPGVIVVHEWWGHNDYARHRAQQLAKMGYTGFALDMYGDGATASHPKDAQKFASSVFSNLDGAQKRFEAARKALESHASTDGTKTAAIGYCFGGGIVLAMARQGVDLAGVASFHGSLATARPATAGGVKAKVLVLHGSADPFVPAGDVVAFKKEMTDAEADFEFVAYPGVVHSFTNPGADAKGAKFKLPLKYDEAADKDSWARLEKFLATVF